MIKIKRAAAICILFLLSGLFCAQAFADLGNTKLKYDYKVKESGGKHEGTITCVPTDSSLDITCEPGWYTFFTKLYFKQVATLTLTNNYDYPAALSYNLKPVSGNQGRAGESEGDHSVKLQPKASHTITFTTGNETTGSTSVDADPKPAKYKLTNISLVPDSVPVHAVVRLQNDNGTLEDHPTAGTATVSADTIQLGTEATFTAKANDGYDFVEWRFNGASCSKEASCTKTIESYTKDENGSYVGETLTAVFKKAAQNVMVKVITAPEDSAGNVTASVDGTPLIFSDGSVAVPANKTVKLTAQEADDYIFAGWLKADGTQYEDGVDPNNRRVLNLDVGVAERITLTAQFARRATFTAAANGSGTATVKIKDAAEAAGNSVQAYASQTVVFEATPDTTHVFDGWYDSDTLVSASATYSHTIVSESEPDLTLTAKFRQPKLTLLVGTGGTSISVNGTAYTSGYELPVDKGSSVTLTATADAANGYSFAYWYCSGKQYDDPSWTTTVAGDMTITAFFQDSNGNVPGVARIGNKIYGTLKLALDAATSGQTVVLIKDYTLTESVTVKSGVKLLIPLSDDDTGNFGKPTATSTAATSTVFRKLTVASGVTITVNGEICVNSQQFDTNGGNKNGQPVGPCGRIELESGASMEFNSGANLYAYGYVTGAGKVTLHAGANCYECFQIMDWPGGTLASGTFVPEKVFPVMQYTFQNVEAQMEVQANAGDYAYYAISISGILFQDHVGIISADGLFRNTSGSVYKEYFPETDRVQITLGDGAKQSTAYTGSIKIDAKLGFIGASVDSAEYECPIFGGITVRISKNASFTVNHKFKFLPGAEIIVDEGGTLTIGDNGSVYLYDLRDYKTEAYNFSWGAYPSPHAYYTGSTAKKIQLSEMGSAKLEVNGTLNANGGLYTSNNGNKYNANLTGGKVITGTGQIAISEVPDTTTIYEILNLNSNDDKTAITFYRVQAYLAGTDLNEVARLDKNTTYYGVKVGDKTVWYTHKATFVDGTQTLYTVYAQNDSTEVGSGTILNGNGEEVATITDPASKVGYTFSGWSDAGAPAITTAEVLGQTISGQSYKAIWTAKTTAVTLDDNGGTGGESVIEAKYGLLWDTVTTLPTRVGYKFTGYFDQKIGGTQYINNLGNPIKAWDKEDDTATLYAHWIPLSCTITVKSRPVGGGDASIADVSLDGLGTYNLTDSVTFNAPKVKNYTFKGWFVERNSYEGQEAIYTSHVVTEEIQDMVDNGLFDTSTVLNLVAVYESKPETTPLTLKLDKAPTGVEVSWDGAQKSGSSNEWEIPIGTEVTITVPDLTGFQYWTNANDKVMSREKTYTFTMVTNTTLTAVTNNGTSGTFVIFQSADGRLLKADTLDSIKEFPAAPYRVGYTFAGWKVGSAEATTELDKLKTNIDNSLSSNGTVTVTAAYTEAAGTSYNVTATANVDGVNIEGSGSSYKLGDIAKFTAPDKSSDGKDFRFWASDVNGTNILSFSTTYSFRVTQDTDIYAIYGGENNPTAQPVVRVDNVLKNPDGQTKSLTFMIGASIPSDYELVEMGALYAKGSGDDTTLRVEKVGTGGVYKAVSRLNHETAPKLADFSYALGFKISENNASSTIHLRGYVAVKKANDSTDNTIYYYYSGVRLASYDTVNGG